MGFLRVFCVLLLFFLVAGRESRGTTFQLDLLCSGALVQVLVSALLREAEQGQKPTVRHGARTVTRAINLFWALHCNPMGNLSVSLLSC